MRDVRALRSWLFVSSIDEQAIIAAADSGADVAIAEFEDFTPPDRRPAGRAALAKTADTWREAGITVAVRINPPGTEDGPVDLIAALNAGIRIIAFPKTTSPEDVLSVAATVETFDKDHNQPGTPFVLVPNIETAAGLRRTFDIANAHPAVGACLVASEDMAADLGIERTRDSGALRHVRERFLVDCVAAGVVAIDCPYTWSDAVGVEKETHEARHLGYKAKSAVSADHIPTINRLLTPSDEEIAAAHRVVEAFEKARGRGQDRALLDGHAIEMPTYRNAQALLARAALLGSGPISKR